MDTSMSRRAFLKNAALAGAALIAAPALLSAVEPQQALAADGACTCNVWVQPTGAPAIAIGIGKKAYMTNPNTPDNGGFPTSPRTDANASYVVDGDYWIVTIPLVNTMFQLTSVTQETSDTASIVSKELVDGRIQELVVRMPANTAATYKFTATEYAGYALFAGTKTWPINVELSL